ncbi:MAG TPA: hypothetical protein VGS07_00680 [Thermoanaerobaculia bacterium]|nr:hypothetical protein [Thermoanaerobaculia bacterium]
MAELDRQLAAFDQESRDRGYLAFQDFRPFQGIEERAITGRQPSLNTLARHFEDLRMVSQVLSNDGVIRNASLL